jgi:broad specificity phosphatase PhoE
MSVILLVRHGQASAGSADYDQLSALGEKQATILGEALASRGIVPDVVFRGALRRHRQTTEAAMAAAGWAGDVVVDDGWNEFDHVQMLELHPPAFGEGEETSREAFERWFESAVMRWVGGQYDDEYDESFTNFTARVESALSRTVKAVEPNQLAVVFTSGGVVSWVAASLLGGTSRLWTQLVPVMVNSSVSKVVVGRRGSTLVSLNDHSHLEGAGVEMLTYV